MSNNEIKLIGVCISQLHQEDRYLFIQALNKVAVLRGYRLLIFNACTDLVETENTNTEGERSVFRMIPFHLLSAMIVFPFFLHNDPCLDKVIEQCHEKNIPVLSIDKEIPGCACFAFSYANIFEQICAHVIDDHNAKNLLMMAGGKDNPFSEQRVAAFRHALTSRGMYYDDSMIGYGDFWEQPALEVMREWFEEEERPYPDAIICANDTMAIAVSTYLQKHGCRVPEDCIVTGFDNIMLAGYHIPHLTTCQQDYVTMGKKLIDTAEAILRGEPLPPKQLIGFSLIRSQSCGCEKVSFYDINDTAQEMHNRVELSTYRQEMMCCVQSEVAKMHSLQELPSILANKFVFPTLAFAINDDIFNSPHFGTHHRGDNSFTQRMNVVFQRYFWYEVEPCVIGIDDLVPHLDYLTNRDEPIVVCAMHFLDLTLGYCVFQPSITFDDYEKMHTFMNAINASFGAFHAQMQIRAINRELQSVNEELDKLYVHDYLTGLYNRRGFYREFARQQDVNRNGQICAFLISVDLDRLKYINDTFGHLEGDSAICTVANALRKAAGDHDICARFGGDEFAVGGFLPCSLAAIGFEHFRRQFEAILEEYNRTAGKPYPIIASLGFCAKPISEDIDLDEIIKTADNRMYEEKQAHRRMAAVQKA